MPVHAFTGVPLCGTGLRFGAILHNFAIEPGVDFVRIDPRQHGEVRQRLVPLILEQNFTVPGLFTAKATLVHDVMVVPAQQNKVVETGLTAIGPVPDVVSVHKTVVRAARKTTALVS